MARRSGYKTAAAWATPNGATPGASLSSTSTAGPGRGLGGGGATRRQGQWCPGDRARPARGPASSAASARLTSWRHRGHERAKSAARQPLRPEPRTRRHRPGQSVDGPRTRADHNELQGPSPPAPPGRSPPAGHGRQPNPAPASPPAAPVDRARHARRLGFDRNPQHGSPGRGPPRSHRRRVLARRRPPKRGRAWAGEVASAATSEQRPPARGARHTPSPPSLACAKNTTRAPSTIEPVPDTAS